MGERRAVSEILSRLKEHVEQSDAEEVDTLAKTTIATKRRKAFKKRPDFPLGVVIKKKLAKRANQSQPVLP